MTDAAPRPTLGSGCTGNDTDPFDEVAVTTAPGRDAEAIEVVRVQAQHGVAGEPGEPGECCASVPRS